MERANIRLGKIFGIPVGMSWTLMVVVWLFSLGLAEGHFPAESPGHASVSYWLAALVTVVVFFGSVLAHELAHALMAKRYGIRTEDITLWMLGGVARLTETPKTPAAQAKIAGIGPITSGAIGALLLAASWGVAQIGEEPLVVSVLRWLGGINLLMAAFNSLPASPLDGGSVLSAIIWWRKKNAQKGQIGAAQAGRILGAGLLGFGAIRMLMMGDTYGLWGMLIGWFIWQNAQLELRGAEARNLLQGLTAVEATIPDPPIIDEGLTVDGLIAMMGATPNHSAFVVRESDGVLRSVITMDDIRQIPPNRRSQMLLRDTAIPIEQLTTAWDTDSLLDVIERAATASRPEIVVYDDRMCLVGVISREDLIRLATHPPKPRARSRDHG